MLDLIRKFVTLAPQPIPELPAHHGQVISFAWEGWWMEEPQAID